MKRKFTNIGFHFYGWNEKRVPIWGGTWRGVPLWFCRAFQWGGAAFLLAGIGLALAGLSKHGLLPAGAILGFIGVLYLFIGWMMDRQRRGLARLQNVEALCQHLGVNTTDLEQWEAEGKIKPRVIVNEEPLYDVADLGDFGTLLRASAEPTAQPKTLLRPAGKGTEAAPDELLRSSDTAPHTFTFSTIAHSPASLPNLTEEIVSVSAVGTEAVQNSHQD